MKVVVIGAQGTVGQAVCAELGQRHEIVSAGPNRGEHRIDLGDRDSIKACFEAIGPFDALVSAAGNVAFKPVIELSDADYRLGLEHKLLGQVNLVLMGLEYMRDGGSFTLTSGISDVQPIAQGSSASMVNGALSAWVMAAAPELPRGIRLNTVAATVLEESVAQYGSYFAGHNPVPSRLVGLAYAKSVEGIQTGQTYRLPG